MIKRPIVFVTVLYVVGILISNCYSTFKHTDSIPIEKDIYITGVIDDEPAVKEKGVSFTLRSGGCRYMAFVSSPTAELAYGDLLNIVGFFSSNNIATNPDQFNYQNYLERKGIAGTIFVNELKIIKRGQGNIFRAKAIDLKNRIVAFHSKYMPAPYSSLFGSIIFGLKASPIAEETRDRYQKAGVVHILVVSGQQVSILMSVCLVMFGLIKAPKLFSVVMASFLMWMFTAMSGFGPSIVRSAIMGQITLIAIAFDKENDFFSSISLAALILLLANPNDLLDIGFQLSFLATWSLVCISPVLYKELKTYLNSTISAALSITIAPVIITMPISVYYFSQLTPIAFIANIIVVPIAEIMAIVGFVSSFMIFVFAPIAIVLDGFLFVVLICLDSFVQLCSNIPFAYTYIRSPSIVIVLVYYAIVVYVIESMRKMTMKEVVDKNKMNAVLAVAFILSFQIFSSGTFAQKDLTMTMFDVGQGDSILFEMPNGAKVLIDGGDSKHNIVPFLQKKGINELNMVILTHPHDDHVGGLVKVLEKIKVDEVFDIGYPHTSKYYYRFLRLIEKNKIKYSIAKAGQTLSFGDVSGNILAPFEMQMSNNKYDMNNLSVVVRFVYGNNSFLLTGDAGKVEEDLIMQSGEKIQSNILKIGHHGSRYSTGGSFLAKVHPQVALISVGNDNRYGHPNLSTIKNLRKENINIFRTDLDGAVIIKSDGNRITCLRYYQKP